MREILFRGKTVKGEWVYGCLLNNKHDRIGFYNNAYKFEINAVIPETVGQYTGKTDKNGKKIFEGDIVEFTDKYTGGKGRAEIVFEAFKWKYSGCYYGGNPIVWLCIDDLSIKFEVIGNIYENPDLLEEKK